MIFSRFEEFTQPRERFIKEEKCLQTSRKSPVGWPLLQEAQQGLLIDTKETKQYFRQVLQKEMNPVNKILETQAVLVLDGAFSTELEKKGYDLNDPLWSARALIEKPEAIAAVHEEYYAAGADCVITASYQATYQGFMARGLNRREAKKLIASSVTIASTVRDKFWADEGNRTNRQKTLVAASIGPYGAYLADGSEYRGKYGLSEKELMEFHRERLETLVATGPDILACETLPCLLEAKALIQLIRQYPEMYCWVSFSARDGEHTSSGESMEDCAAFLDTQEQVSAIGVNCTHPKYIDSLIEKIKGKTDKPVIVYPNGGQQYNPVKRTWLEPAPASPDYGEKARSWYNRGARIIGGCCKTTPEDIRRIADWVHK